MWFIAVIINNKNLARNNLKLPHPSQLKNIICQQSWIQNSQIFPVSPASWKKKFVVVHQLI